MGRKVGMDHLAFLAIAGLVAPLPTYAQTLTTLIQEIGGVVAVNPVTNRLYVANYKINVVDGATNSVLPTSIPAQNSQTPAIAINPVTNKIYVSVTTGSVAVIDGSTNSVNSISVGDFAWDVAVNPVTNKIYVIANGVTVIDGATGSTSTIPAAGSQPFRLAVNPITNKIYAANAESNNVTVIDGATNSTTTVPTGSTPFALSVDPVTNKIYVANMNSNTVTVIDGATNSTSTINVGMAPLLVTVNAVTNKIYVANNGSNTITVIDGLSNSATGSIPVSTNPIAMALNPVTNQIYVASDGATSVLTVIDGATGATSRIPTGGWNTIAVNPVTNKIYLSFSGGEGVAVIDGASNSTPSVPVGSGPGAVAVNPVTNKTYVANNGANSVTAIDGATNATSTIETSQAPTSIVINSATNKIYVAGFNSGAVTVIDGNDNSTTQVTIGNTPISLAVDPVRNKIYAAYCALGSTFPGGLMVIDGSTNTVSSVNGVTLPGVTNVAVAINPATNKIYLGYVGGTPSNHLIVIDPATSSITSISIGASNDEFQVLGVNPVSNKIYASYGTTNAMIDGVTLAVTTLPGSFLALNPATNRVYLYAGNNTVSVVDGTSGAQLASISGVQPSSTACPFGLCVSTAAANPASNKIYLGNSIIDGATNSIIGMLPASSGGISVNPITGKAYITNPANNTVTILTEQYTQPIPIQTTVTPFPNNESTSATLTFTFTTLNSFTSSSVDNLFYQMDSWQGPWTPAVDQGSGSFTATTIVLQNGFHILYAYSTDGEEATSIYAGNSPVIGSMAAYEFLMQSTQVAPTVSLVAPSTATYLSTFTVTATTNASTTATITASGPCTISGSVVTVTGTGACQLLASWPGDQTYLPAFATATVTVDPAPVRMSTFNVSVVSSPIENITLVADVTSPVGVVNEGTVTFFGIGSAPVINGVATATVSGYTPVGVSVINIAYTDASNNFANTAGMAEIIVTSAPGSLGFVPVTPCRVADTRNPNGPFGGPEMAGGSSRDFVIPNSACSIPSNAAAYSLNVTVVPDAQLNYLTVWPSGQPEPLVSTLNSDGRIKANAVIVPAGTNGAVSVFVTDPTQVVLDINGYFVSTNGSQIAGSPLEFFPVTPCRIADTRQSGSPLAAGETRSFGVGNCLSSAQPGVPEGYSLNITAVPHGPLGYLTAWGLGSQPFVSTLNAPTGTVTANAAITSHSGINIYATDETEVIIDINGYFGNLGTTANPAPGGLWFYPLSPCRILDTRNSSGQFNGTLPVNVMGSGCGVASNAQAFALNATVVPPGPLTYLTLWPDGQPQPVVSTLNALDGAITSNMAIAPTTNGLIDAFSSNATQLILDLFGYFAP